MPPQSPVVCFCVTFLAASGRRISLLGHLYPYLSWSSRQFLAPHSCGHLGFRVGSSASLVIKVVPLVVPVRRCQVLLVRWEDFGSPLPPPPLQAVGGSWPMDSSHPCHCELHAAIPSVGSHRILGGRLWGVGFEDAANALPATCWCGQQLRSIT